MTAIENWWSGEMGIRRRSRIRIRIRSGSRSRSGWTAERPEMPL
jgi:hypothetical protein